MSYRTKTVPTPECGVRPPDGIADRPFSPVSGSNQFRIPALYTMEDGTVVASADARWNTNADGCGLDTMVSTSADNGRTWHYTFANYLGDNGNRMNRYSTAFIDPLLAVRDGIIYLLVDLHPGSTALNSSANRPRPGTGYDETGRLLLKTYDTDEYNYVLGSFDPDGFAKIFHKNGTPIENYTVDRRYNLLYKNRDIGQNLFYFTSPYRVFPTSHLYLTTSADKGKTWTPPLLLNPMVKNANEPFYGTAPGRGLVTESGRILFPCYYYIYGVQGTSFIYSDDGVHWKRTPTLSDASSESQLAELSDGRIRAVFRNRFGRICYADATPNPSGDNYTWGDVVKTDILLPGRASDCQIAAMRYSKTVGGCDVLLVACPNNGGNRTDGGGRFHGILRTMMYDPRTGETKWTHAREINGHDDFYGYSCLTELSDGTVALLYESESDVNFTWKTFAFDELH